VRVAVIDCVTVTVAAVLNAEADEVAEPVVGELDETLLKVVEPIVEEKVPLVLVGTVVDDVDVLVPAVVADELVAVPPQTMFSDTARGVAYTVGLELALAEDEA
jgi:hypothetical protein